MGGARLKAEPSSDEEGSRRGRGGIEEGLRRVEEGLRWG